MLVKTKSWSRLREPMRAETALGRVPGKDPAARPALYRSGLLSIVMAGRVPPICASTVGVDGRDTPGHDGEATDQAHSSPIHHLPDGHDTRSTAVSPVAARAPVPSREAPGWALLGLQPGLADELGVQVGLDRFRPA